MIIYWIREPSHTDIYSEGYVGITKKELSERLREHKKNKKTSIVSFKLNNKENLISSVIEEVDTLEEALLLEEHYRPTQNIGWNLQKGGEIGVESSWYLIQENKQKHSMKTSEATRRGIAAKDTKEARSIRAKINHTKNKASYTDIVKGSKNPRAILNEEIVAKIKYDLIPKGFTNPEIANMFGVKHYVICQIRTGKNWSYV